MAFVTEKKLTDCKYNYSISPNIKKYTLRDVTFIPTKLGQFEFKRLLEINPNSGEGFLLKIIFNSDLTGFKLTVTDASGLRPTNIFKNADPIIIEKFYFQMQLFVDREVFIQSEL
ncbi:MAG: cysteine desulfurase [Lactovum sp.]